MKRSTKKRLPISRRAHGEDIESSLFPFWMSLALELLCRAALAKTHPVLLADPTNEGNIHYAFGINPKTNPRSVQAKTVFARCSIFISNFTDGMAAHCLIVADRRNSELHSGAAAFEGLENSSWLPASYEVFEVVLKHLGSSLNDFLGEEHAPTAEGMLKDRRVSIKKHVLDRIAAAKRLFDDLTDEQRKQRQQDGGAALVSWLKGQRLRNTCVCPSCRLKAGITGESHSRGPVRIDVDAQTIRREVRVLPNALRCAFCHLSLDGYQEMLAAGLGNIYTVTEDEDPIEFFGIVPEDHVDIDELIRQHTGEGYMNE